MTLDHSRMGTFVVAFAFIKSTDKDYWSALMGDVVIVDTEIDNALGQFIYLCINYYNVAHESGPVYSLRKI